MNEMIIRFYGSHWHSKRGYCELTNEMDKHLTCKPSGIWHTYIYDFGDRETEYYDHKIGHVYTMRLPGATRGCMVTDENGYIEILEFYEDTCYGTFAAYDKSMENIKEKYIGRKVIVE